CRLTPRARTADPHVHASDAVVARHIRGVGSGLLGREGRALARSAKAERSRTLPRKNVAVHVGDGHDRVIEGCLHVRQSMRYMLALLLLERFLLALFFGGRRCAARRCWFCHSSYLAPSR